MNFNLFTSFGSKSINIPDSWDKLTTDQYQRIVKTVKDQETKPTRTHEDKQAYLLELFSILSGIDNIKLGATVDGALEQKLILASQFITTTKAEFSKDIPFYFDLDGERVEVPTRLQKLSIGQNIHVQLKAEGVRTYDEIISFAIAVYLQPLIDKKPFDYYRVLEIEKKVKQLPITKTYGLGFFLLKSRSGFGVNLIRSVSHLITRLRQVFTLRGRIYQRWRGVTVLRGSNT